MLAFSLNDVPGKPAATRVAGRLLVENIRAAAEENRTRYLTRQSEYPADWQTAAGETYFGSFPAAAGTRVEYEGQTADGRTGKVQFHTKDGRTGAVAPLGTYDLADGSLFLVAVRGPRPRVAQLKRDIRKADAAAFQKLPDAEPEIGRFFGAGPPGPGG